ncbi:MAG: right-handed parallel beta-helix repeat-containing protein [Burkholderiaceae bacterium]
MLMLDGGIGIELPYWAPNGSLVSDATNEPKSSGLPDLLAVDVTVAVFLRNRDWYIETDYLAHSLHVVAGEVGIRMMGRHNRISNSRIEVTDSKSAIYLFGPDNVIENNIIVFKGRGATPSAAPIKLHHGDRTIIRNNVIIIEGVDEDVRQAVSLIESRDVVLEGNRVYGAGPVVQAYGEGSSWQMGALIADDLSHAPQLPETVRAASDLGLK